MTTLAERYLDCWNTRDAEARAEKLQQLFTPQVTYTDPLAVAAGLDELGALIGATHTQFPDFVFSLIGNEDAHHNLSRFTWGLGPTGAEPPVIGFDAVVTAEDGRIRAVAGFLDKVPAA